MTAFLLQIFNRSVLLSLGYGLWFLNRESCFGRMRRLPSRFWRAAGILCAVWLAIPFAVPVTFHYTTVPQTPAELPAGGLDQAFLLETHTPAAFQRPAVAIQLADIIIIMWLIGFSVSLLFHLAAYAHMRRRLYRWRTSPLFQDIKRPKEGRLQNVRIGYALSASVPLVSGLFGPIIWLPESWREKDATLKPALLHEITHIRQGDLWVKWLLMWVKSLYWFHPAVSALVRRISGVLEFACDEQALKDASPETRREYSAAILAALNQEEHQKFSFGFLGLWEEENQVLSRIRRIMKLEDRQGISKRKMRGILGIFAVLTAISVIKVQAAAVPSKNEPFYMPLDGKTGLESAEPAVQVNSASEELNRQTLSPAAGGIADDPKENTEVRFHLK